MLQALLGTPAIIRTSFVTRFNSEFFNRKEVQCPRCKTWTPLTHTSHCHYCVIDLVIRPQQQKAA